MEATLFIPNKEWYKSKIWIHNLNSAKYNENAELRIRSGQLPIDDRTGKKIPIELNGQQIKKLIHEEEKKIGNLWLLYVFM